MLCLLIIASDYPHGPFPKTDNYNKADIFKLPYDPSYVGNHKPGYYQNIQDDNDQLGKVLEMVDKYGHEENSMFIYASDHGLSGKWSLQEQGIRLPFIVRWPGKIKPNTTSETLLTLVDVLPTILEVSKTKIPIELDGKSFVESLKGDKKTYQMDFRNSDEALREIALDIKEGADMVMVKPAMPYLDIIKSIKDRFKIPVFAYQVSGEYSLIETAIKKKLINSDAIYESLISFKRAGANAIVSYYADRINNILK